MATGNDILASKSVNTQKRLEHLIPPQTEATVLTVACHPDDYCASSLARAVEDSEAHLINLNVTDCRLDDGRIAIELRTNHCNGGATARSLERYGFEVLEIESTTGDSIVDSDPTLSARAAELLHILNL